MLSKLHVHLKNAVKASFRFIGIELKRLEVDGSTLSTMQRNSVAHQLRANIGNGFSWPNRPVAFVLVSSNHGAIIINRHDFRMIDEQKGFGVGFQILNTSSYDHVEVSSLLALLSNRREFYGDGVVAIDCGANCGVHTIEPWIVL
jgi:hypothetical protein